YAVSLSANSRLALIADLNDPDLAPPGGQASLAAARGRDRVKQATDMTVYELHVRDFSVSDASVRPAWRGKYLAFTEPESAGMRHLRAMAQAGMTDVHLLPVFDLATVPEQGCTVPEVAAAAPDSPAQQAQVMASAASDCFNWGYDPFHFNAPEGSFATDAEDGRRRLIEFRQMVMGLHAAGLRVGMDVVYNHMAAAGQAANSVLDRIVPGYYHRLDANGAVERSTCCDNTATEHRMMGRLMSDSVLLWARAHGIDSFRFDLMGHQPREAMVAIKNRLRRELGHDVQLLGEGWNFGEVADGARFVQASQLSLGGTGIATFNDRLRDAVRGGGAGESGEALVRNQGYINGLALAPNALAPAVADTGALMDRADQVRIGLAGSLRDQVLTTWRGERLPASRIPYGNQPSGYASQPTEVVNYVENHDNHTLFDANVFKLPLGTSTEDRARVQMLGVALTTFSQGIAYFHAGIELLRSKSLDGNSYDSGDWFNRIDWTGQTNHFGIGLPPMQDNRGNQAAAAERLARSDIAPRPQDIALARGMFLDLLRIRASSGLFRLADAAEVQQRLSFPNSGPAQNPAVVAGLLDGAGRADAGFAQVLYFVNVAPTAQRLTLADQRQRGWVLHPVHRAATAADARPAAQAAYEAETGQFLIPARTALVFVRP
ncbi:alpha-1,6-glucosidase domain-containing protein, partial [Ideonella sp.]|uniref:alpha-1,6-glucosidase domain-containing protein n=1 Tax=Ideonella sp. TaxID=1929293 RepID=UPI003BB652EF